MSVEAPTMSAPSIGIESGIGAMGFDVGGSNKPSLNSGIFSMPELSKSDLGNLGDTDRTIPGTLAFTHTESKFQAEKPAENFIADTHLSSIDLPEEESLISEEIPIVRDMEFSLPEIFHEPEAKNILNLVIENNPTTESQDNLLSKPEVRADVDQAIKVQGLWEAVGIEPYQAEKKVADTLVDVFERKGILPAQSISTGEKNEETMPLEKTVEDVLIQVKDEEMLTFRKDGNELPNSKKKTLFEEDPKADAARGKLAFEAIEKVAAQIQEILVEMGTSPQEAQQTVARVLMETEKKKGLTLALRKDVLEQTEKLDVVSERHETKPESYFEHDKKADEARKKAALNAIETVVQEVGNGQKQKVTGKDLSEKMPSFKPEVMSEIAKNKDGSYESLISQLQSIGVVRSEEEAKIIIEDLIMKNHGVRKGSRDEATEQEVEKVLNGKALGEKEIVIYQS